VWEASVHGFRTGAKAARNTLIDCYDREMANAWRIGK